MEEDALNGHGVSSAWQLARQRVLGAVDAPAGALGHRCLTPELPLHDPAAGYADRARPAIEALASTQPPVAVVGHSLAVGVAPIVAASADAALVVVCAQRPADRSPVSTSG
jgi:hypothetical protein